ncbi:MAG: YcbK family protein [Vicinamibacterales bacterium]
MSKPFSRRHFLGALAFGAASLGAARSAVASSSVGATNLTSTATRALSFSHTHTGEKLDVAYFSGGTYLPDALSTVNHFLRDFRTGDVHEIDAELLDLLHNVHGMTESSKPFQVISGYRSPKTNATLRQHSEGVAAGSLHMVGQAIDIRLADIPLPKLRSAALAVKRGGVGFYAASNFVHVDTGRVRTW